MGVRVTETSTSLTSLTLMIKSEVSSQVGGGQYGNLGRTCNKLKEDYVFEYLDI